jgi:hypothetical protein
MWPLTGLLFIHNTLYEYGEPQWNDTERRKPKNKDHYSSNLNVFLPASDFLLSMLLFIVDNMEKLLILTHVV